MLVVKKSTILTVIKGIASAVSSQSVTRIASSVGTETVARIATANPISKGRIG